MKLPLRILTCLLAVLLTLEVCARVDDWISFGAPLLSSYDVSALYVLDDGVQRGKPLGRYRNWQLNSLGLRGPELTPGSQRILTIGASETFGMLETPGMEYPRQLERLLRDALPDRRIDVANLSYFGLTLATANKLLPQVMQQVRPTIVFIYPSYGGYVARRHLEVAPDTAPADPAPTLRLPGKLADLLKAQLPPKLQTALKQREIDAYVNGRAVVEHMPEDRAQFLRSDLENLVATIRAYGAQPVIATHATRFNNDPGHADGSFVVSWRKFYPLFSANALFEMEEQLNATVRQFAAERDVPLVDAAAALPGGSRNFSDHEHFTDAGAAALARLVEQTTVAMLRNRAPLVKDASAGIAATTTGDR